MLGIFSGIAAAACSLCTSIGGVVMKGIEAFVTNIDTLELGIRVVGAVARLVSAVAELFLDKPEEETPEELGVKAEICHSEEGLTPDDFPSVEAYIEHLRKEVQVPPERAVENLSDEDRSKYELVGVGLYVRDMEERLGVELEPEFWRSVYKIGAAAEDVLTLVDAMRDSGVVHGRDIDAFLDGRLEAGSDEKLAAAHALLNYLESSGTGQTLSDLRDVYKQKVDE